jgi:hypothetical protein
LIHVLEHPRTQPQSQQGLERFGGLGERALQAEPLGPIFEYVGEVSRGQTEAFVERGAFDLLPLAGAIDDAGDGEFAEDRDIATVVQLGEASECVSILSQDLFSEVTVSVLGDEELQEVQPQGQQAAHQLALHPIDTQAIGDGLAGEGDEIVEIGLGLEERLLRREDHDGLLVTREHCGVGNHVLAQGGR